MKIFAAEAALWFIWFPFRSVIKRLPMDVNYAVARFVSLVFYIVSGKRRRSVYDEVRRLFGPLADEKSIRRITRKSFDIYLKRQVENLLFGLLTKDELDRISVIEGLENIDKSLERGNGVIMLLAHFGSMLLPLPVLGYRGYKVLQVGGRPLLEKSPLHKKLFELRSRETDKMPFKFVQTDRYLGPIVRELKNNGIVVIAFDGRTGNKWIPIKIMGRMAQFSPTPFRLAISSGAAIVPTYVVRGKDNRHRIIFEPPMELKILDDEEETLKVNTEEYAKIFERYVSNYPCHFAMILHDVAEEARMGLNRPLFID